MKKLNLKMFFGIMALFSVFIFMSIYVFHHEYIGDDVLFYFTGALGYYIDTFKVSLGHKIANFNDVIETLKFTYLYWSGRFFGYLFMYVGKLLPKYMTAIITSFVSIGSVFLAIKIIYEDTKEAIQHHLTFLIIFLSIYWFKTAVSFAYMWTFASLYTFVLFICLLYYILYKKYSDKPTAITIFLFQIFGFIVGFSHEALSYYLIAIIGIEWIKNVFSKKSKWNSIFFHTGLGIGYLLCFFAPGNFNRKLQSHDIITTSYANRLLSSIKAHISIVYRPKEIFLVFLILCVVVLFGMIFIIRKNGFKGVAFFIYENLQYIVPCILSPFVWAFSPRTASYGLDFFIVLLFIVLFRFIKISKVLSIVNVKINLQILCSVILILSFSLLYNKEIKSKFNTDAQRMRLIDEAKKNNYKEVFVPKYDNFLSTNRNVLDYLNDQKQYDTEYYQGMYGIHIMILQEAH